MLFRAAADLVVLLHLGFVVFVVLGGLLVARRPRLAWVHLPAAAWGVVVEFRGWICPLTPMENYLRERSGSSGYQGEFIEHYVVPLLYPAHLTPRIQIWLGGLALTINVILYLHIIRNARLSHRTR
jgi:hypothetical protein